MNLRPALDHSIPIAVLAMFLLNSPFTGWWTRLSLPWYAMFIPWLLLIFLVWLNQRTAIPPKDPAMPRDERRE